VFHAGYLSPYKEMEGHGPNFPEPPPELVEGEPEYKIEHIVNMRCFRCNKKTQYKVRWKGYTEAHDSHQKKSTFLTTSYYILLHLIPLILGVRKE